MTLDAIVVADCLSATMEGIDLRDWARSFAKRHPALLEREVERYVEVTEEDLVDWLVDTMESARVEVTGTGILVHWDGKRIGFDAQQ